MDTMAAVDLELIEERNWREALEVEVAADQAALVTEYEPVALMILAKCSVNPQGRRWEPLLVRDEHGAAVGVLALAHGADDCELRHVAIDSARQGHGFGTAAIRAVVVRSQQSESDCQELIVAAHPENQAAHSAYRSAGFDWNGELRNGEPVWRHKIERSTDW